VSLLEGSGLTEDADGDVARVLAADNVMATDKGFGPARPVDLDGASTCVAATSSRCSYAPANMTVFVHGA
jgi:hypothetical protein